MRRPHVRSRPLAVASLTVAAALAAGAAAAAPSPTLRLPDARDDAGDGPDIQRALIGLAKDGRLRVVVTFTERLTPKALLAPSGPPGSVCLRVWTGADADPAAQRPDRLVCVTARSEDDLRGTVFEQTRPGLPRRSGAASAKLNASGRSLVVRVSQSALGRPARISVAVEATRAGCDRAACVDAVPDNGRPRRFRLR